MSKKISARILKEIANTKKEAADTKQFEFFYDEECKYYTEPAAYFKFKITEGIYVGQTHVLRMRFTSFPVMAPNVIFITTPPFHVNVSIHGGICLDTLQDQWIPTMSIISVFKTVLLLLDDPNNKSPYRQEAKFKPGPEFIEKVKKEYEKTVKYLPEVFFAPEFD